MRATDFFNNLPAVNEQLKHSKFELAISVLDTSLFTLFQEIFIRARYFELGLDFYDICQAEIKENRDRIEDWKYIRYQEYLIGLKLSMLDYLNEWDEYIIFTHKVLQEFKAPSMINQIFPIHNRYVYKDEIGEQLHFLYQYTDRYDIISRKIAKRNAGANIEHLKRHQQAELNYEDIEYRYNAVVYFFCSMSE